MIKLGHFGLAVELGSSYVHLNEYDGSQQYMAPEVYDGELDLKSDVWSLGITLIEMAQRNNPFAGSSPDLIEYMIFNAPPPSLCMLIWSSDIVDFVSKCLVSDVKERWSVNQLLNVSLLLPNDI